jgi:hypothetical protein
MNYQQDLNYIEDKISYLRERQHALIIKKWNFEHPETFLSKPPEFTAEDQEILKRISGCIKYVEDFIEPWIEIIDRHIYT